MTSDRHGYTAAAHGFSSRLLLTAIVLITSLAGGASAQVPSCVGDCDGNRVVSVDELVRGVSIALNRQEVSTCPAFDPNLSLTVTVNELVQGVNSALRGCFPPVSFRGLCRLPSSSGLVPCSAGSAVRLSLCLDRARCLFDPTARRLLRSGLIGADGRFFFSVDDEAILNGLLLLESDVATGVTYRSLTVGPNAAGSTIDDFDVDPIREAIARLFILNGLDLFSDLSITDIIRIVANALANLNFAGLGPDAAAQLAENTANQNAAVQQAVSSRRFTPTPTHTATLSPTAAVTATPSHTATITPTPTITLTATSTLTASSTPTHTPTPTATASPTATPTATSTSTITSTPTTTPTPTASSSPTATLPPLNLAIEVNPDPVRPGETIEASLRVTNTGGSSIAPISLEMVLPENIDPFLDTLASGTGRCGVQQINTCNPGGTLTWNFIGTLAPGEGITLRVPPIVAPGTPNGTMLTFTGTAGAPGLTATKSYTTVVQSGASAPFDLALNQESDPVQSGALLTYTVAYGFRAVVGQAETVLRVRPPAGTTFVSASDGGDQVQGGDIEWALGTLTPGDGGIRRFRVAIDENLPEGSVLEARATIERSDATGTKRANAVNHVQTNQPLGVVLETNPDPARPGENIETSMTITNPANTARMATLDFIVPDQVDTFTDGNVTGGGTCGPFTPGSLCERRARVRWTPLTIPPHDGITVRADPIVSAGALSGSLIYFQARLVDSQGSYLASARRAVRVDAETIFDLHLDEDRDPVAPADIYTYRLSLRHRPADPAPVDAIIDLTLPAGVTVEDASDDGVVGDGTVQWALGSLTSNAVTSREVVVRVDDDVAAGTALIAEAVVRAASDALAAKRVRTITRIALGSPLALSAVVHTDPVRPGEVLETELTVTNTGTGTLSGQIDVRVPDGTDAFFMSLSNGAMCSATTLQCAPREVARWNTSLIPPGGAATIHLPPIVNAATADGTLMRLHARVGTTLGQTPRDAVLNRTIVVDGATPFDLSVNESRDPIIAGQPLVYTLHFGRRAPTAATDALLRLQLPTGVFFVSSADGGVAVEEDIVEWELGELAAGEDGSRQVNVVVDALLEGTPLHARATIAEDGDPPSEKRAEVVTAVGTPPVSFTVTAAPDPVVPGGTVTVSLSLTNNGTTTLNNLSVEGIVPPEANTMLDNTTTGGGVCGPFSPNACSPRARIIWNIPTMTSGQTVVVTMPPVIRSNIAPGTVGRFLGRFQQNISTPPIIATDAVTVTAP